MKIMSSNSQVLPSINVPLSLITQACREGNCEALKALIRDGASADDVDENGWRPIHEAAANNRTECLTELIERGGCRVDYITNDGETPLSLTVSRNHIEATCLLLHYGANPNVCTLSNDTILCLAVSTENIRIVEAVLNSGADILARNGDGKTPLHVAVDKNSEEIVSLLLKWGASLTIQDCDYRTPLFEAVYQNKINFVKLLLDHRKSTNVEPVIGKNPPDEMACESGLFITPMMIAVYRENFEALKLLVEGGEDVNRVSHGGLSAIQVAAKFSNYRCFTYLYPLMDEKLVKRTCSADFLCLQHCMSISRYDRYDREILEYLFNNGQDPNACFASLNYQCFSPIHGTLRYRATCACCAFESCKMSVLTSAIMHNSRKVFLSAFRSGEAVTTQSLRILYPLYAAVINSKVMQARLILKYLGNPNYPKNVDPQKCPFVLEAAFSHPAILVALLRAGGDIRLCFSHSSKPHRYFKVSSFHHVNCLSKIVNIFSGKTMSLVYRMMETEILYAIVDFKEEENLEFVDWPEVAPTFEHCKQALSCDCKKLVEDIDSLSLQHLCRLKVTQTILESNNWKRLDKFVNKLRVPRQVINYLQYK